MLRANLEGNPTVRELMSRVRETALKSYAHQEMPFDMLVDVIGARRELDHSPLFQVLFVLQHFSLTGLTLDKLQCQVMELPLNTARFDLAVDVFDVPNLGLRVYFRQRPDGDVEILEVADREEQHTTLRRLKER